MFNESNSVEEFIRDLLCGVSRTLREPSASYGRDSAALDVSGLGWQYVPALQLLRQNTDVLIEAHIRDALIRLNPEMADKPDRADEVFYKLRAILLSVSSDGLVRANEAFAAWLCGDQSMPFGPNNQHTPVRLIDFEDLRNNQCVVTTQLVYKSASEHRFDLVLFVNGIPLVVGEAKTNVRTAVTWVD